MIKLAARRKDTGVEYTVKFLGSDADQHAANYVTARRMTHVFDLDGATDTVAVLTSDAIYPVCEHGMIGTCYGPHHFMDADQEAAMDWQYLDAPNGF